MNNKYNSTSERLYLTNIISESNITGILRTNNDHFESVAEFFNENSHEFYVYFLDGDNWGQRDIWKDNNIYTGYDVKTPFRLFENVKYKDAIFQWADEIFIISDIDIQDQIQVILEEVEVSMTGIKLVCNEVFFSDVAYLSREVREYKKVKKGCFYKIIKREDGKYDKY